MNFLQIALLAGGGLLVWEYLKTSSSAAASSGQPSTPPPSTSTPASTPPPSTTPPVAGPTTLKQQIQARAGNVTALNMDQWNYYYNAILADRGQPPVSGSQFSQMLASAGLSDSSRGTAISLDQFISALSANGLSGLGRHAYGREFGEGW